MSGKQKSSNLKPWLIVMIALLDDILVLALVFLLLWVFDVHIPLVGIIVIGIVLGAIIFIVHRALVPSLRRKQATGSEAMIGLSGEVTQELAPKGVVRVEGEYWQAKSVDDNIEVGEDVEITGVDRLELEVKRKVI
jgi:membrane-bound ClpP family serine protease